WDARNAWNADAGDGHAGNAGNARNARNGSPWYGAHAWSNSSWRDSSWRRAHVQQPGPTAGRLSRTFVPVVWSTGRAASGFRDLAARFLGPGCLWRALQEVT